MLSTNEDSLGANVNWSQTSRIGIQVNQTGVAAVASGPAADLLALVVGICLVMYVLYVIN